MSKQFNDALADAIENDDAYYFIQQHLPRLLAVCAYKSHVSLDWKYGILVDVDLMNDDDDRIYVHFLRSCGVVDQYVLWCDSSGNAYSTTFFTNMDESLQVIKQCDSLVEASAVLADVLRDGPETLKDI